MDLSFNGKMEAYYQKFIELQEKLRKSEEDRLKLEMQFNEMLQITREEEQAHYKKLRSQYKRFLEEDRKRQERNERIVRTLERIEARVNMLTSRTDRFKMLKRQYQTYLQRISRMKPIDKTEHYSPKNEEEPPREQLKDMPDHSSLKKAMGKSNEEKIKILDKYLQSLASQKYKDTIEKEEKDPKSDLSQLRYLDNISKKMEDGFNSNQANSIAEDIMNSIYSRHYNKDLFKDDTKKVNKLTTSNYLYNDVPLKQKSSDFGDCYNGNSALGHLDNGAAIGKDFLFDESRRNRSNANYDNIGVTQNESEFDSLNKNNYALRENIPKSLGMYDKQDNKYVDVDIDRKKRLENKANMLSKNKDHIGKDPLMKYEDYKNNADPLLKKEENTKDKSPVDLLLKTVDKRGDPDTLLKDKDYRFKDFSRNDFLEANQIQSQEIDPLDKSMEYKNKPDSMIQIKHQPFEDVIPNSDYFTPGEQFKNDNISYGPSKTEIDVIENEKQVVVNNYPEPRRERDNVDILSNDICDRVIQHHEQDEAIKEKIQEYEQSEDHHDTKFADNEINNQDTHAEQFDNKSRRSQNHELFTTNSVKQEVNSDTVLNNERDEREAIIPNEELNENKFNQDNEENDINMQHEYEKVDIQSNEEIQEEYTRQHDINEDRPQYVEDQAPIQYNQYEEPLQYDQFGNQIMYNESGQEVQPQYDENGQPYNQIEPFDGAEQQHDENRLNMQYDESGQPIQTYEQQYDAAGQPILYDQQYVASDQPDQQYDENGQVFPQYDEISQQYDENGDLIPQYDENGQLMHQYNASGQPVHLYDQSDQPIEYVENSQPIQEYGENEQYRQRYEQPFEQYENEYQQPVDQYNQDNQLVQEYDKSFQQYDSNGQLIQQHDENGQPIQQYDENGQPIYQYDQNVQPLQQYDENGKLIHHYDEHSLHQYNEIEQPLEKFDGNGQPLQQHGENIQDVQILETYDNGLENLPESTNANQKHDQNDDEEKSKTDSSKSTVKEDINNAPMVEENSESRPAKQHNVLDMLDTDTESVKQSTSKISNDSDFDFSNG